MHSISIVPHNGIIVALSSMNASRYARAQNGQVQASPPGPLPAKVNYPAASYGASNLQRSRAAEYLTLAAFAKWTCKHVRLAHCPRE